MLLENRISMTSPEQYIFRRLFVPPTDTFLSDEDLLTKIISKGTLLSTNRDGSAIQLDPSHAHNIVRDAHKVVWFVDNDAARYTNWGDFLNSDLTLSTINERNAANSRGNQSYMSYIMVGHGRVDKPGDGTPKHRLGGLASKQFPHIHEQFQAIPKTHPDDRLIRLTDPLGRRTLETQSNLAMDLTLSSISHLLSDFGTAFEYHDKIGVGDQKLHFAHKVFGFQSMSEAIKATHGVINRPEIKKIWPGVIEAVARHEPGILPGDTKVRAGFQLNGMVLHPSREMRERLTPTADFDTWVLLASDGGFSMFVEDGITFDRDL